MSIINSQPLIGASGNQGAAYNLTRSLRFRNSATAYLSRTPSTSSNRRTWTFSTWVKRAELGRTQAIWFSGDNGTDTYGLLFDSTNVIQVGRFSSGWTWLLQTTQVFRDVSAWYHIVVSIDTTQATASNRVKLYVNGSQVTAFSTANYPTQNFDTEVNSSSFSHRIGYQTASNSYGFDGYLAETHFVDGSALDQTSFGETDTATGVWKPKKYTGTYGTNGFYLKFDNLTSTSTLGNDSSGNSNTWTVNNISLTSGATYDSMKDVPTLTDADTANYAVLNPLSKLSQVTLSNGNLNYSVTAGPDCTLASSIGMSSGKWYCEVRPNSGDSIVGILLNESPLTTDYVGSRSNGYGYYGNNGNKYNSGSASGYGATFGSGDVIGIAFDADAGSLTFYKNGTSQGVAFTGIPARNYLFAEGAWVGITHSGSFNFGQQPFAYTPPSGFKALNTFNLPTPTIGATASTQANKYFDAKLYTGTGSSRSVTGYNFSPDFVWIKERNAAADHALYDAVRGVQKQLESNNTDAETTQSTGLTAFNSDGFTVGALAQVNTNTDTYVAWAWDGNGAGSSNTSGTITSTVSANTTAGFSIVTYTGTGANATVGHGLGVAPKMVIVKCRNTAGESWQVYHSSLTSAAYRIRLNSTDGEDSQPTMWNSTAPTSTVFSVGTATGTNANTQTYVAYCFTDVAGYSAFGKYTGNGSTDGTFVYTGFRPKYIIVKRTDTSTYQWSIWDTSRNTYNAANSNLWADSSEAETTSTGYDLDILSNGFKLRTTNVARNASGGTYIYMAFAEFPYKFSNAR